MKMQCIFSTFFNAFFQCCLKCLFNAFFNFAMQFRGIVIGGFTDKI